VHLLTRYASKVIRLNETIIQRADVLKQHGFKTYDALHLACAESANVSIFLTTDDRLAKRAKQKRRILRVEVFNPIEWSQEEKR